MTTDLHKSWISKAEAEGYSTRGFRAALVAYIKSMDGDEDFDLDRADVLEAIAQGRAIVPDAYRIDPERKTVEIVEVCVTYSIALHKLDRLASLANDLDAIGVEFLVTEIDKLGGTRVSDLAALIHRCVTNGKH